MALIKRVHSAYLFPNGNLAACDTMGNQIPELQGAYSIDKHKRILLEASDACMFKGFSVLPPGFIKHAYEWAVFFRERNMSFEEIENL
jgi:hypothetical protein